MTWDQIVGLVLALLVMGVGLAGSVLPALPGPPLVLAAAVGHRLWFGAESVGNVVLLLMILLTGLSILLDYAASLLGAQKFGATWRGVVGAGLGVVLGVMGGPIGILIGPFLGAMLLEWASGREMKDASRAGLGAFVGFLAGSVGKVACCVAMMGLFVVNVAWRTV
ncbi:MAG TPA: DUF456 domain-containing protein [Verrucomicrobiota bacterium]|nr:DUF456 domain-containing protein [Verrucomicrobiota bacterium]HNU49446.1 DUF456 domain-containing protein [Verrucomicrobiota bacterium]